MGSRFTCVAAGLALLALPAFGTPVNETALGEREAQQSYYPEEPQTLGEIYGFIHVAFGVPFAEESLPEHCIGEPGPDERFPLSQSNAGNCSGT